jgi:hypothetical protein
MTWLSNSVTFVRCDDAKHDGDPITKVETGYMATAREALRSRGWGYLHGDHHHTCPDCVIRNIARN